MTVYRKDPGAISNYFNKLMTGIGHRGSSFADIDAITHDGKTGRFLIQEFKWPNEKLSEGQHWMLSALAKLPNFTVWYCQPWEDGQIAWIDMRAPESIDVLTTAEYQQRVSDWWTQRYYLREEDRRYPAVNE